MSPATRSRARASHAAAAGGQVNVRITCTTPVQRGCTAPRYEPPAPEHPGPAGPGPWLGPEAPPPPTPPAPTEPLCPTPPPPPPPQPQLGGAPAAHARTSRLHSSARSSGRTAAGGSGGNLHGSPNELTPVKYTRHRNPAVTSGTSSSMTSLRDCKNGADNPLPADDDIDSKNRLLPYPPPSSLG